LRRNLVPAELQPNYQRFVRKTFGGKAHELGLVAGKQESEDTRILRPVLVTLVAESGEDEDLQEQARPLALKWLEDHRAIDAEMVDAVLGAAARHGDRALFDRLLSAAKQTQDRTERGHLVKAMASFQDPRIVAERMALLLTDDFDPREAWNLVFAGFEEPELGELAYGFLKKNYAVLAAKIPKEYEAYLVFPTGSFCDPEKRIDVEKFFTQRTSKAPGGPRILAQVLEQIDLCIARKQAQQASLRAFLEKQ
jgi:alanyl aminopeptidase